VLLEHDSGEAVHAHELDEAPDLRLRGAQDELMITLAQPARDHQEIEHERRIRENQLGEIDHDVAGSLEGSREGPSAKALCRTVLVS